MEALDFFGRLPKKVDAARRGRRARALMIKRRLAVRGGFDLVVVRPVLEAGPEARASGLVAFPRDGVFHGGRSQVRIVDVVHRAVGEELALYPCAPGRRRKRRVLPRADRLIRSRPS